MADSPTALPAWLRQHIELYLTDPEKAHMWDSSVAGGPGLLPTLLLTTKGRKSGRAIMLPLIYKKVDDTYVIIASKGGAPAHPSWYLNLQANPNCEIRVGALQMAAQARDATAGERTGLWQKMAEIYPPYDDYQSYAGDRTIPVVVLEISL